MSDINEELIIVWEAPQLVTPEFRLYYDEAGKVICYSCEKLEGNYIVIDANTFAQARPDVRVINGKISMVSNHAIVSKLMPHGSIGQLCEREDVSIVTATNVDSIRWKLNTYELE